MQLKTEQIPTVFAPEIPVPIEIQSERRTFDIPELLVLPLEEMPVRTNLNLWERAGIPFSAIND